jgi:uncharacterized protein YndB with AHSA1/START domain
MFFDAALHLAATTRYVGRAQKNGAAPRSVELTRQFAVGVQQIWDAITQPARLGVWYGAVAGDLRAGKRFAIAQSASGAILHCRAPFNVAFSWEYGASISWVNMTLTQIAPAAAALQLVHSVPLDGEIAGLDANSLGPAGLGIGWEWSLMELARHLARPDALRFDEQAFAALSQGRAFIAGSAAGWAAAAIADGDAPALAKAAAARAQAFFCGE